MGPPRPRPDRIDVIATVAGVLAALAATWGVKVGLARWREEEAVATFTEGWHGDSATKRRVGRIIVREMGALMAHPHAERLRDLGRSIPSYLSDTDLATMQSLRKRMAFASERTCACLWDGAGCAQSDLLYGMSALSDDEIEVWYHLMARAGRAQLDGADTIPADPANLDTGMRAIMRAMSDQDRDRFIDVAEGRTRTMADRCFAARALFTGLEALEPPRQAPFTRALLSAGGAQ